MAYRIALWVFVAGTYTVTAHAQSCKIVPAHAETPAEQAYMANDYQKSADLYRSDLAAHASDPALTAAMAHVLLEQGKTQEADDLISAALAAKPDPKTATAILLTAKAEAEYREGTPWEVWPTLQAALQADICVGRVHWMVSRYMRLNSMYALAQKEIVNAHKLDPNDPDIRETWQRTLPIGKRIADLESFLASPGGTSAGNAKELNAELERLKKVEAEAAKPCRLVSTATSTELPFQPLTFDSAKAQAYGLDVKVNGRRTRLQIDTGAGGVLITRAAADRAGLKAEEQVAVGGIGDKGSQAGYLAYADTIQIGGMEFHDCQVEVVPKMMGPGTDGLIGMDVFSNFLVTLDYPGQKLQLGPLPPRPGQSVTAPTIETASGGPESTAENKDETKQDASRPSPAPVQSGSHGPFDRYQAPEMKDYTAIYRYGHNLMLPVALNHSKNKLFILDTGAWETNISPLAAREVTTVLSEDAHVRGLSGEVKNVYSAHKVLFTFAHIQQEIVEVPSFDTTGPSQSVGLEVSGFIGARTLQQTTVHIDYRDGLVKFDYDPKKAPPPERP